MHASVLTFSWHYVRDIRMDSCLS